MTGIDLHASALSRGYLPAGLVTDDLSRRRATRDS